MNKSEAGRLGGIKSAVTAKKRSGKFREDYIKFPKQCEYCKSDLSFKQKYNKFCNQSCAALFNNNRCGTSTKEVNKNCVRCDSVIERVESNRYAKHCQECISKNDHIHLKVHDTKNAKTGSTLRRIILETRVYECNVCKLSEWMQKPMPLQVDHIDGNPTNNDESNLRLLCCNCHAQTPTFGNKNKGNGRAYRRAQYHKNKIPS